MLKSRFEFADVPGHLPPDSIVIRDIGHGDGYASITNDAESVIETVLRVAAQLNEPIGPNSPPVYYYDSEHKLGQLQHDGAAFVGFGDVTHGRD